MTDTDSTEVVLVRTNCVTSNQEGWEGIAVITVETAVTENTISKKYRISTRGHCAR